MSTTKYKWTIFYVTAIGNFIAMLDTSTVNIALYKMATTFDVTIAEIQWVVVAYMLTLTVLLPLFGKLADVFPKNKLYALGFIILGCGLFLDYTAQSLARLVLYRCIEAVGASILLSCSSAIIASVFKGGKRGKALGLIGAIIALAGLSGPAVAGVLINYFSWKSIFLPGILIAVFGAYLSYKLIPTHVAKKVEFRFDFWGFILFSVGLFSVLLAIMNGHSWGWNSSAVRALSIGGLTLFILFFIVEKRVKIPIIDLELFKNKTFSLGCLAVGVSYLGLFANGILFPFYAQQVLSLSPLVTGFLILPFSFSLIITAPFSGNYAGRRGARGLTLVGPAVMAVGLLMFTCFAKSPNLLLIVIAQLILGIGNGLFQSPSNTAVICSVDKSQLGTASGVLALFRNTGMIVAIAYSISLFYGLRQAFLSSGADFYIAFIDAYHITLYVGVFFALTCGTLAYFAYKKA